MNCPCRDLSSVANEIVLATSASAAKIAIIVNGLLIALIFSIVGHQPLLDRYLSSVEPGVVSFCPIHS